MSQRAIFALPTLSERFEHYMSSSRCPIWPDNWRPSYRDEYYRRLAEGKDTVVRRYEMGLENRRREKEGRAFAKERGVEYDSDEKTPSPPSSPAAPISVSPQAITPKTRASNALLPDLQPYEPMFLMPSHFEAEESSNFRLRFFRSGGRLGDINEATIILTKVCKVRRAKLDLRSLKIWTEDKDLQDAKPEKDVITVVNVNWIHKSWEAEKLLPISDYLVYRGLRIPEPKFDTTSKHPLEHDSSAAGLKKQRQQ